MKLCVVVVFLFVLHFARSQSNGSNYSLDEQYILSQNCTPAAILEFPRDLFTKEQRTSGAVLLHAFFAGYLFLLLAIVCDRYFVPSINIICQVLHIPDDVAGATLMAGATSSPELFINLVGTFVTKGDVGIGTVMGSAVFNILAVPASCAILAEQALTLEWWPFTRECIMYCISVVILIYALKDGRVQWYEALVMVFVYFSYITGLCISPKLSRLMNRNKTVENEERSSLVVYKTSGYYLKSDVVVGYSTDGLPSEPVNIDDQDLMRWPKHYSVLGKLWWLFLWPINVLLMLTIPDCRKLELHNYYWITFMMSMIWIGTTSYLTSWMITVLGDTLNIPDSVVGITFLAAGTSLPEAVSSVIVIRQGRGTMGISNSIGSNTFDILLCLGLPWFVKAWFLSSNDASYVSMHSGGLQYSALLLLSTLIILYICFCINRFRLGKRIGILCLFIYAVFLFVASLIEMNVFTEVNLPTCET